MKIQHWHFLWDLQLMEHQKELVKLVLMIISGIQQKLDMKIILYLKKCLNRLVICVLQFKDFLL